MKTESDEIIEIAKALGKAQSEMEGAQTDGINPHYSSKYATLRSVVKALLKPFSDNEITYLQREVYVDGQMYFETRLIHSSGQWFASFSPMELNFKGNIMHQYGSSLTYLRRFGLCTITGLAPAEDDDGNTSEGAVSVSEKKEPEISKSDIDWIRNALSMDEEIRKNIWGKLNAHSPPIHTLHDIPKDWVQPVKDNINQLFTEKTERDSNNV